MEVKSTLEKAKNAVGTAFTPTSESDILTTLKREHDEVRQLFSRLEDADDAATRKAVVSQIRQALVPHTEAEERVVYDAVLALQDREAQVDGHEGYLEHALALDTLARLEEIGSATSPEHKATAKVLKELVEHHIQEEEHNVWGDVKDNFSAEARERMNEEFEAAKSSVDLL